MNRIPQPRLLGVILTLVMAGCVTNKYALPKLVNGPVPDPASDLAALQKLFAQHQGSLYGPGEHQVTWKDTQLFRLYEFSHHTVVVFPYHWTAQNCNLILFAGHITPNCPNPYDALFYEEFPGPDFHVQSTGIVWDWSDPKALNSVTFEGFHLGTATQSVLDNQRRYIEQTITDTQQKNLALDLMAQFAAKGVSEGSHEQTHFRFYYDKQRLGYMNFEIGKNVTLAEYAITHPKTPIIRQGTFELNVNNK